MPTSSSSHQTCQQRTKGGQGTNTSPGPGQAEAVPAGEEPPTEWETASRHPAASDRSHLQLRAAAVGERLVDGAHRKHHASADNTLTYEMKKPVHLQLGAAAVGARLVDEVPRHDGGVLQVCAPIDAVHAPADTASAAWTSKSTNEGVREPVTPRSDPGKPPTCLVPELTRYNGKVCLNVCVSCLMNLIQDPHERLALTVFCRCAARCAPGSVR